MTIGLVAEGPSDCSVMVAIAEMLYPGNHYRYVQPEIPAVKGLSAGYKGVRQWCGLGISADRAKIVSGQIDMYIVQLDGDTTREKYIHCDGVLDCPKPEKIPRDRCNTSNKKCPIEIAPLFASKSIEQKMDFLQERINAWLTPELRDKVIFCFPFDSTESWIVAAFDGDIHGDLELIEKPGDRIIARAPYYHEIRVERTSGELKKPPALYEKFIPQLCENWSNVKCICKSAERFEIELNKLALH